MGIHRVRQGFRAPFEDRDVEVWTLVIAATLEELFYRGFLVGVCFLLSGTGLIALALVGTVIVFALSHIWFGWAHVLAKLPLGALAMIAVVALGTVLPAIVAHAFFNFKVWKDMRPTAPRAASPGGIMNSVTRRYLKS